tara:strand:+ start:120 stop:383 length:264 start_codon:yes stop_codon:yes gene_type:complete
MSKKPNESTRQRTSRLMRKLIGNSGNIKRVIIGGSPFSLDIAYSVSGSQLGYYSFFNGDLDRQLYVKDVTNVDLSHNTIFLKRNARF